MSNKPITPAIHGAIDYFFGITLLTVPPLIGCSKKAIRYYRILGAEVILYGAITKQPLSAWPLIPMKTHRSIDVANLAELALLTCSKEIRRNSNASIFTWLMVAAGATAVLLTKWEK